MPITTLNTLAGAGGGGSSLAEPVDISGEGANVTLKVGEQAFFNYDFPDVNGVFDIKVALADKETYRIELYGDDAYAAADTYSVVFKCNNNSDTIGTLGTVYESSTNLMDLDENSNTGIIICGHRLVRAVIELAVDVTFGSTYYSIKANGYGNGKYLGYNTQGVGGLAGVGYVGRLTFAGAQKGRGVVTRIA